MDIDNDQEAIGRGFPTKKRLVSRTSASRGLGFISVHCMISQVNRTGIPLPARNRFTSPTLNSPK
jgi:hypothetical protein